MDIPKKNRLLTLVAHLAGWALFVQLAVPRGGFELHEWLPFTANMLLLAAFFYLNMHVLVTRFLFRKKVDVYVAVSLLCFFMICYVVPSFTWQIHTYFYPGETPFPRRLPGDFPPPDEGSYLSSMVARWRMYNHRLHNPTTHFLLAFIVSSGLKSISQLYNEQRRALELEKSMIQAELSFLKSQIHPHFLFNCLNSIYYMTLSGDRNAPKTVLSLSDFLRFVIIESDSTFIPLDREIGILEEYLNLQSIRTSEQVDLCFVREGNFKSHMIMPLTFIPFVENAFKYGISAQTNCFIYIRIEMTDKGVLHFSCDNSIMPSRNLARSSGVGLENIKKRLELAYPGQYSLKIDEDSRGYHVKLKINIPS